MTLEENIPLAPLTTFRLGGAANYFVRVQNVEELKEALAFAQEKSLKIVILGGGSNMLIADQGFDGLVIKIEIAGVEKKDTTYRAGAGESWDALVARSVEDGLWGLENLSGIPGTVGGAVVQNIGAYGAALSQTLVWVQVYDRTEGKVVTLERQALGLGYRDSVFKTEPDRYVVLRAALQLAQDGTPNISYKDLAGSAELGLTDIRAKVLAIRAGKFPDLAVEGTAGSFFKNPIVSPAEAQTLQEKYPEMPVFAMPETDGVKIPLAWLLDKALGLKGMSVGGARLYEKQPLVIAARHASSADVESLARAVEKKIKEALHITVEREVKVIHS